MRDQSLIRIVGQPQGFEAEIQAAHHRVQASPGREYSSGAIDDADSIAAIRHAVDSGTLAIVMTRIRSTALLAGALVIAAWAVLYLAAAEPNSLIVLGAAALVAVTAAMLSAQRLPVSVTANAGPPESAGQRRRGAYLRQSNPDTAGRPRPRAPGAVLA
ncbi:DUF6412 domain-containing protein [Nocardia inohanensis]|uniref:DUF6412 domain-containing protein n=1 Tax=Nocardia inohanensis TaxID=209246 RepID=UPI000AE6FA01|nr:DUF6412 domain-containing protein [Nocardia inohanensis]